MISSEPFLPRDLPLMSVFVIDQAKIMKNSGYEVCFMSLGILPTRLSLFSSQKRSFINDNIDGLQVYSDPIKKFFPLKYIPEIFLLWLIKRKGLRLVEKYIRDHGLPSIVHSHNTFYAGYLAHLLKKKYEIKIVITEHSSLFFRSKLNRLEKRIFKEVWNDSDFRISVSEGLSKYLSIHLAKAQILKDITVMPNVPDIIFESPLPKVSTNQSNTFTIVNVANLVSIKNHELLIKSFKDLSFKLHNAKLILIGDGPLRDKLQGLVENLNLVDLVIFKGYLDRLDVRRIMLESDIFVLTSKFETFGVVIMEALLCGLPVVSTPCEGPKMMIRNGINGFMIEKHEAFLLKEAILKVYGKHLLWNREEIHEDAIAKYGSEKIKNNLISIYDNVCKNN